MDEDLWQFALKAFVTLFVVVDPLGVAPSFIALTGELGNVEKRRTLGRALIIAFGVTLFFLVGGRWLLSYLGVTVHAFAISGGILLFVVSWPMLFGHRPGLQAPERDEKGMVGEDIAIFPLAILCFLVREPSRRFCSWPIKLSRMFSAWGYSPSSSPLCT